MSAMMRSRSSGNSGCDRNADDLSVTSRCIKPCWLLLKFAAAAADAAAAVDGVPGVPPGVADVVLLVLPPPDGAENISTKRIILYSLISRTVNGPLMRVIPRHDDSIYKMDLGRSEGTHKPKTNSYIKLPQ